MKSTDTKIIEGEVTEALPNTMFKVKLEDEQEILATLKGRLRRSYVRIFPGDFVKVEMTKYDQDRGRIVFKYRKKKFNNVNR
jgi:translation initiation factor IF-1